MSGENRMGLLTHISAGGSSPRERGKLVVHIIEGRGTRLIPA